MESKVPTNSEHIIPMYTKVIDGRTYQIGIHFAKTGATFQEKYERMLRQELLEKSRSRLSTGSAKATDA